MSAKRDEHEAPARLKDAAPRSPVGELLSRMPAADPPLGAQERSWRRLASPSGSRGRSLLWVPVSAAAVAVIIAAAFWMARATEPVTGPQRIRTPADATAALRFAAFEVRVGEGTSASIEELEAELNILLEQGSVELQRDHGATARATVNAGEVRVEGSSFEVRVAADGSVRVAALRESVQLFAQHGATQLRPGERWPREPDASRAANAPTSLERPALAAPNATTARGRPVLRVPSAANVTSALDRSTLTAPAPRTDSSAETRIASNRSGRAPSQAATPSRSRDEATPEAAAIAASTDAPTAPPAPAPLIPPAPVPNASTRAARTTSQPAAPAATSDEVAHGLAGIAAGAHSAGADGAPTPLVSPTPAAVAGSPSPEPLDDAQRWAAANRLVRAGSYAEALALLDALAAGSGSFAGMALYESGRVRARHLGQLAEAREAFATYQARFPQGLLRAEVDLSALEAALAAGDLPEALGAAHAFLAAHPRSERRADVRLVRANALRDLRRFGEARAEYEALAREGGRTGAEALYFAAFCAREAGDDAGARQALEAYLAQHPNGPRRQEALRALGRTE